MPGAVLAVPSHAAKIELGRSAFDDVPIGCGNNPGDLPNISSPTEYAEEGNISHFDSVRLEWFVPDRLMRRLPGERSTRREAPPMRTGKGRIEFGCCVFVVAVQRVWRDYEQAQIIVVGLDQTFLAHERSVSVIVGKPRSNRLASVARIGDPGKVRDRSLNRIG